MSRFLTRNSDDTYLEEIENMKVCRWKINEICCNDRSPDLADYPYPSSKCESKEGCSYFEKENGIIGGKMFEKYKKWKIKRSIKQAMKEVKKGKFKIKSWRKVIEELEKEV